MNVEFRIVYPVPTDDCELSDDPVFDDLVDKVFDLFPEAVMSGRIVWSDRGDAA
jgi:hypothetical protein